MFERAQERVPQCDPRAGYFAQREEIDAAVMRVLTDGRYVLGPETHAFEREFASFIGVDHAIGVANGTDALSLALRAVGVGQGDAVITVAHTAVATTVAIRQTGANPVYVDITQEGGLMAPDALEDLLRFAATNQMQLAAGRLKAIVPVHLYGQCADMGRILALAERYELSVVEDCAQAHGASLGGRRAGCFGAAAAFSFYPTKNLGAIGDGGAVVTRNARLADQVRLLREYGWKERYVSDIEGGNSRLDELQSAILRVKLRRLDDDNRRRREIARLYDGSLTGTSLRLPAAPCGAHHVYHQYAVQSAHRDALRRFLDDGGIGTLVHYPVPVHRQPAYQDGRFTPTSLPVTEAFAASVLSLPMYPQLETSLATRVVERIAAWETQ